MKLRIARESRLWIGLVCMQTVFFIFLAWLSYPETFGVLVGMMIIFSIVATISGVLLTQKLLHKREQELYHFLKEPSMERQQLFIHALGEKYSQSINDLGNHLRALQDELEQARLRALDYEELVESWVHEIKTPISLMNFVLQNRQGEMSRLVYQRMEHAKIKIHDHVEKILFYARLQATHSDYKFEMVSLNICCEDVLLELQSLVEDHEVQVISHLTNIRILSDERVLQFILTQILINAVHYSGKQTNRFIQLESGLDTAKNRYFLKILDNGVGVLQSDLPFIFDKGFTGTHTNRNQSTGIGLYLVQKLCDGLKIDVEVDSKYGEGFCIQLFFPRI